MFTRRGVILGSASFALAGCRGGNKGAGGDPITGPPPPPVAAPPPPTPPPLPSADDTYRNEILGYGALQPDPAGIFDLPKGFSYRIISRHGETMSDGLFVPDALDGMGSIDLGGGRVALIRNHELSPGLHQQSPTGGRADLAARLDRVYDRQGGLPHPGGTTTIEYDYKAGKVLAEYASLAGTLRNCAGGVTPWGSWLSCEETLHSVERPHGWVFEVPALPRGLADPVPLMAMGRFNHEAAVVDPVSGIVYLTEDRPDGLFYRFLPASPGKLSAGGRLQAMGFSDASRDTRNWSEIEFLEGSWRNVRWLDLDGVDSAADDLRLRGYAKGAALFARGEGIHLGDRELYFTCTSGGPGRHGQIMRYVLSGSEGRESEVSAPGRLQLFSESDDARLFTAADNIAVTPWSHLIVCEDKGTGDRVNHLKGVTPQGQVYAVGRNAHAAKGELAGPCFSPDGSTMFVNIYTPGMTLAITGPWQQIYTTAL